MQREIKKHQSDYVTNQNISNKLFESFIKANCIYDNDCKKNQYKHSIFFIPKLFYNAEKKSYLGIIEVRDKKGDESFFSSIYELIVYKYLTSTLENYWFRLNSIMNGSKCCYDNFLFYSCQNGDNDSKKDMLKRNKKIFFYCNYIGNDGFLTEKDIIMDFRNSCQIIKYFVAVQPTIIKKDDRTENKINRMFFNRINNFLLTYKMIQLNKICENDIFLPVDIKYSDEKDYLSARKR